MRNGERAGDRTRDLLIKSQMLYQLSYALGRVGPDVAARPCGVNAGASGQNTLETRA